jgi:uncharacterized membrane protein
VRGPGGTSADRSLATERRIGRLLIAMTLVAVGLLVIGAVLMVINGVEPDSGGPSFRAATLAQQITSFDAAGFLWLGLIAVIAAPIGRVIVAAVAYAREGDRLMVAISLAILLVITIGIASALTATV